MKVEWAGPAILDVRAIKAYLAKDSTVYASRFAEPIVDAAESLHHLPLRGRTVPEAGAEDIRELLFGNYRIIYREEPTRILVMTAIHAARNPAGVVPKPWDVL